MPDETKVKGTVNEANYSKEKEYTLKSFPEAQAMADELFAPYIIEAGAFVGGNPERTHEKAKVRIRRKAGSDPSEESFRVVLYKSIKDKKRTEETSNADDGSTQDIAAAEGGGTSEEPESGSVEKARPRRKAKERRANGKEKRR